MSSAPCTALPLPPTPATNAPATRISSRVARHRLDLAAHVAEDRLGGAQRRDQGRAVIGVVAEEDAGLRGEHLSSAIVGSQAVARGEDRARPRRQQVGRLCRGPAQPRGNGDGDAALDRRVAWRAPRPARRGGRSRPGRWRRPAAEPDARRSSVRLSLARERVAPARPAPRDGRRTARQRDRHARARRGSMPNRPAGCPRGDARRAPAGAEGHARSRARCAARPPARGRGARRGPARPARSIGGGVGHPARCTVTRIAS